MSFNHTTGDGSRKTKSIRQRFPMLRITRNRHRFLARIIVKDRGKFFNCWIEFSSFKPKHMIFVIPEFHNDTKEIPLDFDIPQSLNSLQFVGYKIGPSTEIKATNPSIDIMNC